MKIFEQKEEQTVPKICIYRYIALFCRRLGAKVYTNLSKNCFQSHFCLDSDVKSSFTAALLKNDEYGAVVNIISTTVSIELDALREDLSQKYQWVILTFSVSTTTKFSISDFFHMQSTIHSLKYFGIAQYQRTFYILVCVLEVACQQQLINLLAR